MYKTMRKFKNYNIENEQHSFNLADLKKKIFLLSLTIKNLRYIAQSNKISLKRLRNKSDIVTLIHKHFSLVNNEESPIIAEKFEVLLDEKRRINIASWFTLKKKKLSRFLSSKNFKRMKKKVCEKESLSLTDVMNKNGGQVFVHLNLALLAASSLSDELFYNIYNLSTEMRVLQAEKAQLKNKPIDVDLVGGEFLLYAYACNSWVKFGTSFCNKTGQRPKSHRTSVPELSIGFVIYASKPDLQNVNKAIKHRFCIERKEHINCSIQELEDFVIDYLKIMNFKYEKEDLEKLKLLNIFLKS